MIRRLLLVRHGESHGNRIDVYSGRKDYGLTKRGVAQAKRVSELLRKTKLSAVYSSPVKRAYDTAEIIAKPHGIRVRTDDSFIEPDPGRMLGMKRLGTPLIYRPFYTESVDDMQAKAVNAVEKIATKHKDDVLIVSHATPIRLLLYHYMGRELTKKSNHTIAIGTGSLSAITFEHQIPMLLVVNYPNGLEGL